MQCENTQNGQFLVGVDKVHEHWERYDAHERSAISAFVQWGESFLTRPNVEVGRRGHVCPFVRAGATIHKSIYISNYRGETGDVAAATQEIHQLKEWLLELIPSDSKQSDFGAIVQLFPRLGEDTDFILQLHKELKPGFVQQKLMLGEFFAGCQGQGIHNPDFRPLQSPVPLFVIRHMHILDLPFLTHCPKQLAIYRERFQVASRRDLDKRVKTSRVIQLPRGWDHYAELLVSS